MVGSRRARLVAGMLLVVVVGATACSGAGVFGGADDGGDGATTANDRTSSEAQAGRSAVPTASGEPSGALATAAQLPALGPSVIKTATVEIAVGAGEVEDALQEATQVAGRHGGYISSTTIDAGRAGSGTVVIRVPSTDFEATLAELEGLGEIGERSVSGQDVSQQFVDLEARLRNWRAQEAVLLRLMDRAVSVTDTIRVQGELARVQLEIERLRGRLGYLEDQTAMGTVTATFTAAAGAPNEPSTLARAWARALDAALSTVSAVIVAVGFVLPPALLAAVVLVVIRALRPRLTS